MRIGLYPFAAGADIGKNAGAIRRGIEKAAAGKVRLLAFQECAACGYPPIETPDIAAIDWDALEALTAEVGLAARRHNMYIALGSIRREGAERYNTLLLLGPEGKLLGHYDKRALWGWDVDNFARGASDGIFAIDGFTAGLRICFELRFPEYFREAFRANADFCIVSFCDVAQEDSPDRYDLIAAHLRTRAAENAFTVLSVNSISQWQGAPTAVLTRTVLSPPKRRATPNACSSMILRKPRRASARRGGLPTRAGCSNNEGGKPRGLPPTHFSASS